MKKITDFFKQKKTLKSNLPWDFFKIFPAELILYIASFLENKDVGQMSRTAKIFALMLQKELEKREAIFWLIKIKKEVTSNPPLYKDKANFQYKKLYLNAKKLLEKTERAKGQQGLYDCLWEFNLYNYDLLLATWLSRNILQASEFSNSGMIWLGMTYAMIENKTELFDIHINFLKKKHMDFDLKRIANKIFETKTRNWKYNDGYFNDTITHIAAKSGIYYIQAFLELGGEISTKNSADETPFSCAWKHNNEVFEFLINTLRQEDLEMNSSDFYKKYNVPKEVIFERRPHHISLQLKLVVENNKYLNELIGSIKNDTLDLINKSIDSKPCQYSTIESNVLRQNKMIEHLQQVSTLLKESLHELQSVSEDVETPQKGPL